MKRALALLPLLLLLAADAPPTTQPAPMDPSAFLLPPPPADSDEAKAEFALLLQLQQSRTPAQIERITAGNSISMATFTPDVGPWFTEAKLPQLANLLLRVDLATNAYNNRLKLVFMHPRPGDADPQHLLKPLFNETDPGYPSGHSLRATVYALLLSRLMPDLKAPLIAHAQQLGFDRVIAGMHYPSDVAAGRTLGAAITQVLLLDPDFQNDFAAARNELDAARAAAQTSVAPPATAPAPH